MFDWCRRRVGLLSFLSGILLFLYQVYLWRHFGEWMGFSLSIPVEGFTRLLGWFFSSVPFASSDGVDMLMSFHTSQLPLLAFRLLETIPLAAFLVGMGYFLLRWEKYLG